MTDEQNKLAEIRAMVEKGRLVPRFIPYLLDLFTTKEERIAQLEKKFLDSDNSRYEDFESLIKELKAERDAGKKKFDEMCFDMSLLRQSKEAAESQVASLREALEAAYQQMVSPEPFKIGSWSEAISKTEAALQSTKGDDNES